jgi:hypothetical protein
MEKTCDGSLPFQFLEIKPNRLNGSVGALRRPDAAARRPYPCVVPWTD